MSGGEGKISTSEDHLLGGLHCNDPKGTLGNERFRMKRRKLQLIRRLAETTGEAGHSIHGYHGVKMTTRRTMVDSNIWENALTLFVGSNSVPNSFWLQSL